MVAASWLGILYLFILASILCWIFYGLGKLFRLSLNGKILIEILIGLALMASLYGFINAGVIRVTRINLQLPHLPNPWKGKTAVWVSDTHLGQVRNDALAQKIAAEEKIGASDTEITAELEKLAQNTTGNKDEVGKLLESPQARRSVEQAIVRHKLSSDWRG
jgi:hypothetical protein